MKIVQIGDIQVDVDGSEWVIISVFGRDRISRIRRNSNAHRIHAKGSPILAKSLEKEDDGGATTTTSEAST